MQRFDESMFLRRIVRRVPMVVLWVLGVAGLPVLFTGCVERQLVFETAADYGDVEIEVDGHPVGKAPCTVSFHRYGVREWVARADGYEIASGRIDLEEPWYQYPPMDLVTEGIVPFTIVDRHRVEVTLTELSERDAGRLYGRAKAFRAAAERELDEARDRSPDAHGGMRTPSRME